MNSYVWRDPNDGLRPDMNAPDTLYWPTAIAEMETARRYPHIKQRYNRVWRGLCVRCGVAIPGFPPPLWTPKYCEQCCRAEAAERNVMAVNELHLWTEAA